MLMCMIMALCPRCCTERNWVRFGNRHCGNERLEITNLERVKNGISLPPYTWIPCMKVLFPSLSSQVRVRADNSVKTLSTYSSELRFKVLGYIALVSLSATSEASILGSQNQYWNMCEHIWENPPYRYFHENRDRSIRRVVLPLNYM